MFSEAYLPEHWVPPPACPKDSRLLPPQNDPSGSGSPPKTTIGLRNKKEAKPFKWTADLGAALWTAFVPGAYPPPERIRSPQTGEFYFGALGEFYFGIDSRKTRGSSIPHLGKATQF